MSTRAFRSLPAALAASKSGHVVEVLGRRFTWYTEMVDVRYPRDWRGRGLARLAVKRGSVRCMTCLLDPQRVLAIEMASGKPMLSQGRLAGKHNCGIGQGAHSKSKLRAEPAIEKEGGRTKCTVSLRDRRSIHKSVSARPPVDGHKVIERVARRSRFQFHRLPHILQDAAGLNRHRPGEDRSLPAVAARTRAALEITDFNDVPGSERLFVAGTEDSDARWDEFEKRMVKQSKPGAERVQYVFGELQRAGDWLRGKRFSIMGLKKDLMIHPDLLSRTLKRFTREGYRIKDLRGSKLMIMAEVWINSAGELVAQRLALYMTSIGYVICESLQEVRMANWLTQHRIDFEKCNGQLGNSNFKSDFEIFGYDRRVFIEVWGLKSLKYKIEMERKLIYYWARYSLIQWHAYRADELPDFPKAIGEALLEHANNCASGISEFWRGGAWKRRAGPLREL